MQTIHSNHPYILFFINREGKYEMMSFRTTVEIPKHFLKETSYVYSRQGGGNNNIYIEPFWFKYGPQLQAHYSRRFIFTDSEKIPGEVLALKLLIEDK